MLGHDVESEIVIAFESGVVGISGLIHSTRRCQHLSFEASRDHELVINTARKMGEDILSRAKMTWRLEQVSDRSIQKVLGGFWKKEQALRKEIKGKAKELADMANKLALKDHKILELDRVRQELERTKSELARTSDKLAITQRELNQALRDKSSQLSIPPPLLLPPKNNATTRRDWNKDRATNMDRKAQIMEYSLPAQVGDILNTIQILTFNMTASQSIKCNDG
ncbi:hypothetical protein RhiLY_11506 [Ceratobasidium sp. AG-Ba]|nr:hypothetical protein RhiLY_11506 [Ceratobasidium sp. AG-Ba]